MPEDAAAAEESVPKSAEEAIEAAPTEAAAVGEATSKDAAASAEAAPVDASIFVVAVGKTVEVYGLNSGTEFNGSMGTVEEFIEAKQRWKVKFHSGTVKNFKGDNLRVINVKVRKEKKKKKDKRANSEEAQEEPSPSKVPKTGAQAGSAAATDADAAKPKVNVAGSLSETLRLLGMQGKLGEEQEGASEPAEEASAAESAPAAEDAGVKNAMEVPAAQPAEEKAEVSARTNIAGRWFESRNELVEHVRAVQTRLDEAGTSKDLAGEDLFLLLHLTMRNTKTVEKFRAPVKGFRYGQHPHFPNKSFFVVFNDDTEEPISWMKCVKELYTGAGLLKSASTPSTQSQSQKRPAEEVSGAQKPKKAKAEKELTRQENGLQLLQQVATEKGHPAAARWQYPLLDEARRCFAGYLPCPLGSELLKDFWEKASSGTKWDRPEDPRSGDPLPRKTAWMTSAGCSCMYRYGGVEVSPQEFPPWMLEIMQSFMPLCGLTERDQWPNSCNLNKYDDGQMSCGWHADDEKLFCARYEDARIISVSLGHPRTFELRLSTADEDEGARDKYVMRLDNGDVCTMEGLTQKYYQHRVPKEKATGPRINFTWRWLKKHGPACPRRPNNAKPADLPIEEGK